MQGITKPTRHELSPELREQWKSHLCGLCLSLKRTSGQVSRVLTGYDMLLLSVLAEAQSGRLELAGAGPCALRGFQRAQVVAATEPAVQFATAAALVSGSAGLKDKIADRDLPAMTNRPAGHLARRFERRAGRIGAEAGFSVAHVAEVTDRAFAVEQRADATLDELLEPAGTVAASLFAATADTAHHPENREALYEAGFAFGKLVHLLDAVEDLRDDLEEGKFNPLVATATDGYRARALADELHAEITGALARLELSEPALISALLGPVLAVNIDRRFGRPAAATCAAHAKRPARARTALVPLVMFAFGPVLGRRRRLRRGPPGYGGPYNDPYGYGGGYGYGGPMRRGPSCCDLLACDCCLNECCCGGDSCVCCC